MKLGLMLGYWMAGPEDPIELVKEAEDLGFDSALRTDSGIQDVSFPGRSARWEIRRRQFWQGGQRHELLVLADVSQPLREQERQAWQRLIRVIGHELNNSLAPIKSIAGSLGALIARGSLPDDWRDDMQRGLAIIASRADALGRFTVAYAQLAKNGGKLPDVAYLSLRTQRLFAASGSTLPDASRPGAHTSKDMLAGAVARLDERRDQLAKGQLEAPSALEDLKEHGLSEGVMRLAPKCDYCELGSVCGRRVRS